MLRSSVHTVAVFLECKIQIDWTTLGAYSSFTIDSIVYRRLTIIFVICHMEASYDINIPL